MDLPKRFPPSKRVWCKDCGELLDYEVGSLVWQHREEDLCGGCMGRRVGEEIGRKFGERLAQAIKNAHPKDPAQ